MTISKELMSVFKTTELISYTLQSQVVVAEVVAVCQMATMKQQ
jgi:hypothetical protein